MVKNDPSIKIDKEKAYRVCLIGAKFDSGNMGVSALAASLVKLINANRKDAYISLLISNRSSSAQNLQVSPGKTISLPVVNYRLSPKAKMREHIFWIFLLACIQRVIPFRIIKDKVINTNPFLKALHKADFIGDIRGGDSFSDIYGYSTLLIGSMPAIIVLLLRKKLVLLPQTYGPYNSFLGKYIAKYILHRAHHVLSRDKAGSLYLHSILNSNRAQIITFCPDVAFMLDPIKPAVASIDPPLPHSKRFHIVGLNVNGLMYIDAHKKENSFGLKMDYQAFAQKMALTILEKTDAHILFVPHTFSPPFASDPDACIDVMKSLPHSYKDRIHLVSKIYDQAEIKAIIGSCDFFIGSRMHACIAALSQGIPTVGVAYSKKFAGVFESVGVEDWVVDGRFFEADTAVGQVMNYFQNRMEIKLKLQINTASVKDQIMATFKEILSS
jgi:colanic acid/amylovoran biosynthesis protein